MFRTLSTPSKTKTNKHLPSKQKIQFFILSISQRTYNKQIAESINGTTVLSIITLISSNTWQNLRWLLANPSAHFILVPASVPISVLSQLPWNQQNLIYHRWYLYIFSMAYISSPHPPAGVQVGNHITRCFICKHTISLNKYVATMFEGGREGWKRWIPWNDRSYTHMSTSLFEMKLDWLQKDSIMAKTSMGV